MKLKIAYFGTPLFSACFLEKLLTDEELKKIIEVKLVVTQPDKPVGKKKILTESPVKEIAKKYKIPIITTGGESGRAPDVAQWSLRLPNNDKNSKNINFQAANFNEGNQNEQRREGNFRQDPLSEIDLALVLAFGQIIPKELLTLPKCGFWNIHYSLLPKFRGPSPVAYALILGEKKTGVSIIQMDEKIDHGPIIVQEELKILPDDRRLDMEKKLTNLSFIVFKKLITTNFNQFQLTAQADNLATYTRLLKKSDGFIPLETLKKALKNEPLNVEELPKILKEIRNLKLEIRNSPKIIYDYFRGLYPWPGVWTLIRIPPSSQIRENPIYKRLKITDLQYQVGKLTILRVQLEGKKEVDFETFNRAYKVF